MKKFIIVMLLGMSCAYAEQVTVFMQATDGHKRIGEIIFEDSLYGMMIKPNLSFLPPGLHGFHLHVKPSCAEEGMAAGGHFDPKNTNSHEGPYGNGHLGDLPVLAVDKYGNANTPMLAPRLKVKEIKGHSVMIHAGGDNYSNEPKLGGGGARIACGIIPK